MLTLNNGCQTQVLHLTGDAGILSSIQPYHGNDSIMIGDGSFLTVSHQGTAHGDTSSGPLVLKNVLYGPEMKSNLLSNCQFTNDNPCIFQFTVTDFSIIRRHS